MRYQTMAVLGLMAVSSAGCASKQSVGFTGISGEPTTVATRAVVPATIIYTPSYVPAISAPAGSVSLLGRGETAIRYGGTEPRRSVPVAMGGTMLALSIVDVAGQDFAVLRLPEGVTQGVIPDVVKAELQANAASLTACVPAQRCTGLHDGPHRSGELWAGFADRLQLTKEPCWQGAAAGRPQGWFRIHDA